MTSGESILECWICNTRVLASSVSDSMIYVWYFDHISQNTSPIDVKPLSYETRLQMRFIDTKNSIKWFQMKEIWISKLGGQIWTFYFWPVLLVFVITFFIQNFLDWFLFYVKVDLQGFPLIYYLQSLELNWESYDSCKLLLEHWKCNTRVLSIFLYAVKEYSK